MRRSRRINGFSLIEILMVLAILGILSGLLLGAVHKVKQRSRITRGRHDVEQIAAAWLQYLQEYGRFPAVTINKMDANAVAILKGTASNPDNPRRVVFMDLGTNIVTYADAWGSIFGVALDTDYDNTVTVPGPDAIRLSVAVWSFGPDKIEGTADDIWSWRK
jgi:prepilin-type N-terminal cleavage/methylation domain-containing protein